MEPIRISDLKKIVQNVVLNNQGELNPNNNAYLEEEEIGKLLNHFAAKDISELIEKTASAGDNQVGLDVFESSKKDEVVAEDNVEIQEQDEVEINDDIEEQENININNDNEPEEKDEQTFFNTSGIRAEAKYDLESLVQNHVADYNVDDPCGPAYHALSGQKDRAENAGADSRSIEDMQDNLEKLSEIYTRNFSPSTDKKANEEYTKNNEITLANGKKIRINQYVGLGGNSAIAGHEPSEAVDSDETEDSTDVENQIDEEPTKNIFDGAVSYGLKITGENFDSNLKIDASTEDLDIKFGTTYTKTFDDQSRLFSTVVVRETFVANENSGSGGVALDYRKSNFSTGIYGLYEHRKENDKQIWELDSKFHLKYKDNVAASVNYGLLEDSHYLTADADLNGVKDFENQNLRLAGSVVFGGGFLEYKEEYADSINERFYLAYADAKGGLQFKADDISASLNGVVSYQYIMASAQSEKLIDIHRLGGAVFGNFTKDKFAISAMVNVIKEDLADKNSPASVATNVTVSVKNAFKGITPFLSYTLDNSTLETGLPYKHSISGGVKLSLEDLSNNK